MRKLFILGMTSALFLLSGCIISTTPGTKDITADISKPLEFSIRVIPSKVAYSWSLDGSVISGAVKSSYIYNPVSEDNLTHKLTVNAGKDSFTWTLRPL